MDNCAAEPGTAINEVVEDYVAFCCDGHRELQDVLVLKELSGNGHEYGQNVTIMVL